MHRKMPLIALVVICFLAGCGGRDSGGSASEKGQTYRLRFNPPDSSEYRYTVSSDIDLFIDSRNRVYHRSWSCEFTTRFKVTRDSNDFVFEISLQKVFYKEPIDDNGKKMDFGGVRSPAKKLIAKLKSRTFFARLQPWNKFISMGSFDESTWNLIDPYYEKDHRGQAREYWAQWLNNEFVWRELNPLLWVLPDSTHRIGHGWRDSTDNTEDVGFLIDRGFQLSSVDGGVATMLSEGQVNTDVGSVTVMGQPMRAWLKGKERGLGRFEIATGMPEDVTDTVVVQGPAVIDGGEGRIEFLKKLKMVGGRVGR